MAVTPARRYPQAMGHRSRLLIVVLALALIAVLGRDLFQRQRSAGYRAGQVAAAGYTRARDLDTDAEDAQLADDEEAAGAMWARAHKPARATQCPTYSGAFHRGCADLVNGQGD